MTASLASFVTFAAELADVARAVTLGVTPAALAIENKDAAGFDPVTAADREAERAMRNLIEERFPEHGIAGEEFGEKATLGRYVWSLDPIDGTRAYICGLPSWTTLIALLDDGRPIFGLIDAPALNERYLASSTSGRLVTARGVTSLASSACPSVREARLTTTDPFLFSAEEAAVFERVRCSAKLVRYGQDGYGYARLAAGSVDLVVESGLKPHDIHALVPIIEASGGTMGNWEGGADLSSGRVIAAATRALYYEAVGLLAQR